MKTGLDHDETKVDHKHGGIFDRLLGGRAELVFALLCGALLLISWLGPKLTPLTENADFMALVAAYFFGGYFTSM